MRTASTKRRESFVTSLSMNAGRARRRLSGSASRRSPTHASPVGASSSRPGTARGQTEVSAALEEQVALAHRQRQAGAELRLGGLKIIECTLHQALPGL